MTITPFLRPRLCGVRFREGAIPLDILKDIAVFEEMVIEVAKWRFLKEHPDRQRSPRGFTKGIELKLIKIEEGSAIPEIGLDLHTLTLPGLPPPNQRFFDQAREAIVNAIDAAEQNRPIVDYLPEECLGYFDRIGRSLRDEEWMEFSTSLHPTPVRLTKEIRRTLILASSRLQELTEEVTLRGSIPEADQDNMTFELQLINGRKLTGPMYDQHLDVIIEAFNGYKRGIRVLLRGIGRYNRQNRLLGLDSVEHITILDALDVPARLDELRELKDGWLEGKGTAPVHDGLDWFALLFERYYPDDLPLPFIYPTAEGGVQAEWSLANNEISLDVDLINHHGQWHRLNLATNEEGSFTIDLDNDADWARLVSELRSCAGDPV